MSNSNLDVNKANRANEISELKDLTKYRLDEINKQTFYYTICTVWLFKYCFICNGCWNTCRNSWSIFSFNIYHNNSCG